MALILRNFNFDFEAHNRLLARLCRDANQSGEHGTKQLWAYVFQKVVFFEHNYVISSEQPPETHSTQRSVDLVVREGTQEGFPVILWREDKKGAATAGDIAEVESQGYTAGLEYLSSDNSASSDKEAVWVMTGYGTHSRLWVYQKDDQAGWLEPIWPRQYAHGDRDMYIDLMDHVMEYQWMFSLIKSNPFPSKELINNYIDSRASILVDSTVHHQVQVVRVKEHEYVECRLLENETIVTLPLAWYSSWIVQSNQLLPCNHIVGKDGEVYWFWEFPLSC